MQEPPGDSQSLTDLLPQELLDHIIDYLHNDKRSLSRTCLVAKTWLYPSSYHLFSTVVIHLKRHLYDTTNKILRFIDLLEYSTRVSPYVRDLRISCRDTSPTNVFFDLSHLSRILAPLTKLQYLSLTGFSLLLPTPSSISDFPRYQNLATLSLEGLHYCRQAFSSLLDLFTQIDELRCTQVVSLGSLSAWDLIDLRRAEVVIGAVIFDGCTRKQMMGLLDILSSAVGFETLQCISFRDIHLDDIRAVDACLSATQNLQILHLDLPDRWFSWDPPETSVAKLNDLVWLPGLSSCTNLRTIHVNIPIKMSPMAMHVNRFLWGRVIDMLLSPSSVNAIYISFGQTRWNALVEVSYILGVVHSLDWGRLETLVEQHESLGMLELRIGCKHERAIEVTRAIDTKLSGKVKRVMRCI